jgi:hypothetical protein
VNEVACAYFVHRPQWLIETPMLLFLVGDLMADVREALAEAGSTRSDRSHREPWQRPQLRLEVFSAVIQGQGQRGCHSMPYLSPCDQHSKGSNVSYRESYQKTRS